VIPLKCLERHTIESDSLVGGHVLKCRNRLSRVVWVQGMPTL